LQQIGKKRKEKKKKKEDKKIKQVGGGDGDKNMELHNTITVSSKLTQTSPKPTKLDRIGRFTRFVIALGYKA
jgi:hypothetical protein